MFPPSWTLICPVVPVMEGVLYVADLDPGGVVERDVEGVGSFIGSGEGVGGEDNLPKLHAGDADRSGVIGDDVPDGGREWSPSAERCGQARTALGKLAETVCGLARRLVGCPGSGFR